MAYVRLQSDVTHLQGVIHTHLIPKPSRMRSAKLDNSGFTDGSSTGHCLPSLFTYLFAVENEAGEFNSLEGLAI